MSTEDPSPAPAEPDPKPPATSADPQISASTEVRKPLFLHPSQEEFLGPYRILEQLGQGGMGTVFKAEQREPVKRIVAIKRIKPGYDSSAVIARFESERQALARMDHPHIAKVLDAGSDGLGRPYFVMEYVPGTPILEFADANRLSIRQRLELFLQVCDAISHAHSKALIHRDIKSSNVMAYMVDGKPFVKVIDFGVAKALSGEHLTDRTLNTGLGAVIGTYGYMSPEQAIGSPDIDTRTDVYSLGILLYELLAGVQPFDWNLLGRAVEQEMQRIIREVEAPHPSTKLSSLGDDAHTVAKSRKTTVGLLTQELNSELEWIPLRAIRKERDRRYASAMQLADDIRNYMDNRPLIAGPETNTYRLRKFIAKRKVPLVVTAAMILALVVGVIGTTIGFLGQRRLRIEADEQRAKAHVEKLKAEASAAKEREVNAALDREAYFMRIALADQMVRSSNFAKADELLDACSPALRHWEWFYLRRLGHLDLGTWQPSSGGAIRSLAYSPDGTRLATACGGRGMILWDAASGKEIMATGAIPGFLRSVAFSPNGRSVGINGGDGVVRLYDAQAGRLQRSWAITDARAGGVPGGGLAFSPDSLRIAVTGGNRVTIWDLSGSTDAPPILILKYADTESGVFNGPVSFSPDGKILATAGGVPGESVRFWDAQTGRFIRALPGNPQSVEVFEFSRDGRRLLVDDVRGKVANTWDVDLAKILTSYAGHTAGVWGAAFSPDERFVATTGFDLTTRLWDASTGSLLRTYRGFRRWPYSVTFSPDGQSLVTGDGDPQIRFWDAASDAGDRIASGGKYVTRLTVHGDSRRLIMSSGGKGPARVTVWDLEAEKSLRSFGDSYSGYWAGTPVSDHLVAIPGGTGIHIHDLNTGLLEREFTLDTSLLTALSFDPEGSHLGAAFMDGTIMVWDLMSHAAPLQWRGPSATLERGLAFSPDGRLLAVTGEEGTILWNPADGKKVRELPRSLATGGATLSVAFSRDGRLLATGRMGGAWELWNPQTGYLECSVANAHVAGIDGIAFSPDGSRVVTSSRDKQIKIWEVATHREVLTLDGHDNWVTAIAWTADGRRIVSGGLDGMVRIWDVGRSWSRERLGTATQP
ncbi:MAG: protein kinase [Planctomycetota bacterium]|nr:protein kinase [Planctomycetota bacterium]